MAQTYAGTWLYRQTNTYANALDGGNVTDSRTVQYQKTITSGTGANQANVFFYDEGTITTGANVEIDLQALVTAFGVAALTKLKAWQLELSTATSGYTLKITAGASNGFSAWYSDASDERIVGAGGVDVQLSPVDGFTVDATHKTVKITNPAGGTASYKLSIAGVGTIS